MEDLIGFIQLYGSENSYRQKFREIREKARITCKRCNSSDHYWLNSKQMWQCKLCRFRTSLRSGTIMESSKLPFHYWFIAIWFMDCNKKGTSARNVQRHINHNRHEPIWAMMHKIRSAMGNRDNQYLLTGTVEVDEGFFETIVKQEQKEEPRKRGRRESKTNNGYGIRSNRRSSKA